MEHRMKNRQQQKKQSRHQPSQASTTQRLPTIGATIAALMVTPLTAIGQTTEDMQTLSEVQVRAMSDGIEINRYNVKTTKAGKFEQDVAEVPQAITIVPDTLMVDQNATTLEQAMQNVPSVTFNSGEGGRVGDNINIRGFYTFGDMYIDGIRDTAQYNRDTFNDGAIEVLRGSASMLFGRGQAGGVINQVWKKAYMDDKNNVQTIFGSYDYFRTTADLNMVLNRESNTAFRVNAVVQSSGSSRNWVTNHTQGVAPSLSWGIGTYNQIDVSYYYLNTKFVPDYGIGFNGVTKNPIDVPGSTFSGTRSDIENNNTQIGTISQNYSFDKDTSLVTKLRYSNYNRSLWANKGRGWNGTTESTYPYPVTTLALAPPRGANEETTAFQSDFNKTAKALGMEHTMLAGVEYYREHVYRYGYDSTGCQNNTTPALGTIVSASNIVVDRCIYGYANQKQTNPFSYSSNSYALFGQDMIELVKGVKLLGGYRQDWLNATYNDLRTGSTVNNQGLDYSEPSYRAGLLYQPAPNAGTFYLSWSNSFSPTADLYQTSVGASYPAERSSLSEVGWKGDVNDLGLSFRASLYHQVKNWERETDLEANSALRSQRRHTDGFEVELTGSVTEKWDIFSGFGYMDARIDQPANPAATQLIGQAPSNTTPYTYNVWTTYKLPYGWRVGGGVYGVGRRYVFGQNGGYSATFQPNWLPAYAQVDGLIEYDTKRYTVRFNAYNLFNTTNYTSAYINGQFAVPGTYQSFQGALILKF